MGRDSLPFGHGVPGGDSAFEAVLRTGMSAQPQAEFRAAAKAAFLVGAQSQGSQVTHSLEQTLRTDAAPKPDGDFRARVRGEFMEGAPMGPRSLESARAERGGGASVRRSWIPAMFALAAALLVAFLGPRTWRLLNSAPLESPSPWS
ncbi:MAG: hypothetical protein KDB61_12205, partial [Planctomycetes bacterium]|nr:hypothetical protein [Planctomycetota bacterium]